MQDANDSTAGRVNEFSRPLMCRELQKCFFHILPIKAHLTSAIVTQLLTEAGQKKRVIAKCT